MSASSVAKGAAIPVGNAAGIGKLVFCLGGAIGIFLLARFSAPVGGLDPAAQAVLGVVAAGTVLWISEAVPLGVTALLVLALLGACPGFRLTDALVGFTSEVAFFLIGAVAIGAAVETTGLAERVARLLSRKSGGSPLRLFVQMIAALPVLAFIVPSAITRNAILIPAYRDALSSMRLDNSSRAGRAIMLALGMLNPLASSALLTGGIASFAAASLLGGFSWLQWFVLMAVPYYALILIGGGILRLMVGRFETATAEPAPPPAAAPFSANEQKTLFVLAATSLLWLSDAIHGLSPATCALLAAVFLLCPHLGVLSWKTFEAKLSWGLILTVGASMSLARLMTQTGAAAWLGDRMTGGLSLVAEVPHLLVLALIAGVTIVHLAITNLAACIALLIPIAATIAVAAGLNPLVCGLIVTITVDAVILYPVQTASNLMAYESGSFSASDVRRLGLAMFVATCAVVFATLPYWSMLGFPLVR